MTNILLHAYAHCKKIAKNHYENFPVASLFIPKKYRRAICVIYAFGRTADDIADEGVMQKEERFAKLHAFRQGLQCIESIIEKTPLCTQSISSCDVLHQIEALPLLKKDALIFVALKETIEIHGLPMKLFYDQLIAFEQDVTNAPYPNFNALLDYCKNSVNPFGRLLLHLTHNATEEKLYYSDCICTAIQLINLLQDLKDDIMVRQRCYLPEDLMQKMGISYEELLSSGHQNFAVSKKLYPIIQFILQQAEKLLEEGKPLLVGLTGRLRMELRLIWFCLYRMIQKIKSRHSPFERPTLKTMDWSFLLGQTLWSLMWI